MKYRFIAVCLAVVTCAACAVKEEDIYRPSDAQEIEEFHASIEDSSTRVYVDDQLRLLWNADDRVSIFNRTTYNRQYRFEGQDGDNSGSFSKVPTDDFVTSNPLNYIYSVYPYNENTRITNDGDLSVFLPAEQGYRAESFGLGANTMIAVAEDNELMFKNLCGYLMLKLYGEDVNVSSITLKGNNGEPLAGKATVIATMEDAPALTFDASATDEITLTFSTPVCLGTTAETATPFWLVVPPTVFEGGITLTVETSDGAHFQKTTSGRLTVSRSKRTRMAALEVEPVQPKYLAFVSEGTTTVSLVNEYGMNAPLLYYSIDKTNWTEWDYSELTFTSSQPLYFRGKNPEGFSTESYRFSHFKTEGSNYEVSGDIMSLIYSDQELTSIPSIYCFYRLFSGCTGLVKAPSLPATSLADYCYTCMFQGCTSLTTAPNLPATTLAQCCYGGMLEGCTSLTTAPNLPATTLAQNCYGGMFDGCTSLTIAPNLPATTLAQSCYGSMFDGCTSLTTAPNLPATTMAQSCYQEMFRGCTSLTTAPNLPATTLAQSCYQEMFRGCTSLTTAPDLPATTLAQSCCQEMFKGCTSLTKAPNLPATTLAQSCCQEMFEGCISLTKAPNLPATTLAASCYYQMFRQCTSLTTAPDLPATTMAQACYGGMFDGCTSLTTAPDLPATTLAASCYYYMFEGCTSLTKSPSLLPATTLATRCYYYMFWDCTSLTQAPDLPAPILVEECYQGMFSGCSQLNHIKCLATDIRDAISHCVSNWTYGVATSGTFIKASDMKDWQWGSSGVPDGWIIQNDGDSGSPTSKYLTFSSEGTTTISLSNYGGNTPVLYYSTDKTNWTTWDYSPLTFTSEQPLYLCGNNPEGLYSESGGYSSFISSGSYFGISGDIMSLLDNEHDLDYIRPRNCFYRLFANCKGLVSAPDLPARMLSVGCYSSMFSGCINLTKAPALPATTLARYCYDSMFSGCTSLTKPPALPATTLEESCYNSMFYKCTNLTTAPDLPAGKLVIACYYGMFRGCYKLNYIKCLATDLNEEQGALGFWLEGVASIGTFIKAPGVISWRKGSSSGIPEGWAIRNEGGSDPSEAKCLTFISEGETTISLRLTNNRDQTPLLYYSTDKTTWKTWSVESSIMSTREITFTSEQPLYICGNNPDGINPNANNFWCYFSSSGSNFSVSGSIMTLINPEKELSAIPSDYCFARLFYGCSGLVSAPDLPATTLTRSCYSFMFYRCSGLTTAPDLPATTLAEKCYMNMFMNCSNLTAAPDLPATTLVENCYARMFYLCRKISYVKCLATDISASGCLDNWLAGTASSGTFVKAASMDSWPSGASGIPEGWTVQNEI